MRQKIRPLITLMVLALVPVVLPGRAGAAASAPIKGASLAPFLQQITISPTSPVESYNLEITNNDKVAQKFNLSVVDFGALDETGGVAFIGDSTTYSRKYGLSHWIKLDKTTLAIAGGRSSKVQVTITDDNSLAPGGHYAAVVVQLDSADGGDDNRVSVKQKLSALILAVKTGGEHYDLHLDRVDRSRSLFKLPDSATPRFQNRGNVQLVPRGTVVIKSSDGHTISRGIINEQSSFVLPETYRQFQVDLNNLQPRKWWSVISSYQLQVNYRYDGFDQFAVRTYNFRQLNLGPLLILLGIVVVAILVARYWLKRRKKSKRGRLDQPKS